MVSFDAAAVNQSCFVINKVNHAPMPSTITMLIKVTNSSILKPIKYTTTAMTVIQSAPAANQAGLCGNKQMPAKMMMNPPIKNDIKLLSMIFAG